MAPTGVPMSPSARSVSSTGSHVGGPVIGVVSPPGGALPGSPVSHRSHYASRAPAGSRDSPTALSTSASVSSLNSAKRELSANKGAPGYDDPPPGEVVKPVSSWNTRSMYRAPESTF